MAAFEVEKRNSVSENDYQVTYMEHTAEPPIGTRHIQENLQHCYADGEDYVRQNPTKTALIAMGLGFLLAQLAAVANHAPSRDQIDHALMASRNAPMAMPLDVVPGDERADEQRHVEQHERLVCPQRLELG